MLGRLGQAQTNLIDAADALTAWLHGEDSQRAEVGGLLIAKFVLLVCSLEKKD